MKVFVFDEDGPREVGDTVEQLNELLTQIWENPEVPKVSDTDALALIRVMVCTTLGHEDDEPTNFQLLNALAEIVVDSERFRLIRNGMHHADNSLRKPGDFVELRNAMTTEGRK